MEELIAKIVADTKSAAERELEHRARLTVAKLTDMVGAEERRRTIAFFDKLVKERITDFANDSTPKDTLEKVRSLIANGEHLK